MEKIPYGFCHCGCGQKTRVSKQNHKLNGWIKGEPLKYVKYHRATAFKKEDKDKKTYPIDGNGRRLHIVLAEKALGKKLPPKSRVHHVDLDFRNYENSNLVICQDDAYHRLLHIRTDALTSCGNANYRRCVFCKTWDDLQNLSGSHTRPTMYHKKCNADYHRNKRHENTTIKRYPKI